MKMEIEKSDSAGDGLDLASLMDQIRDDAEKRKRNSFSYGVPALYRQNISEASPLVVKPFEAPPDHAPLPPLKIQADLEPREEYSVGDLLGFHDEAFVRNAYEAVLKREPDDAGLAQYLQNLRSGRYSKIDILRSLRYSPEGQGANVTIHGLGRLSFLRKVYRVPVAGYLARLAVAIGRLPVLITNHRQLESHTMAQFDRVAAYINDAVAQLSEERRAQAEATRKQLEDVREQMENFHDRLESFGHQVQQQVSEHWDTARLQINSLVREQDKLMQNYSALKKAESTLRAELFSKLEETRKREGDPVLPAELQTVRVELEKQVNDLRERLQKSRMDIAQQERRLACLVDSADISLAAPLADQKSKPEVDHALDSLFVSLEDALRGTSEQIKEEAKVYLPVLQKAEIKSGILDVGCGRGEWLQLLAEAGFEARGIDQNRMLVQHCRDLSLDVVEAEALAYLGSLPEDSLNAVTAFHFVEHVPLDALIRFIDEAGRVLKPAGLMILETPNPENLLVGSCNFYLDPTHENPIPVQTMTLLLEARGFRCEEVFKLHPVPNVNIEVKDQLTSHVNHFLYGPMNYAIVARKPDIDTQ
jgi:O-antigen chain-terminating methyltransferase